MSDNVIPFSNEEPEDEHCCESCDLILEFIPYVKGTETTEELFEVLSALVSEAKNLGLKNYLIREISSKMNLVDHLEIGCDCEEK